jgi:transcriptional regulator with XRE-family HTH domain
LCIITCMSINPQPQTPARSNVPQFQMHHRMRLALEASGVEVTEMAETLGMHVNSVYNYMHGDRQPKLAAIKVWAMRTGVPWRWIVDGTEVTESEDGATDTMWYTSTGYALSVIVNDGNP